MSNPNSQEIIEIFNQTFSAQFNTQLIGGGVEPEYVPANRECSYNQLIFRSDFSASALHEIAHWCIAGEDRRRLVDFGYWYRPEGRKPSEQEQFEHVEVKPQALEWLFSLACGQKFTPSVDNLSLQNSVSAAFEKALKQQFRKYLLDGLPARGEQFVSELLRSFRLFNHKNNFTQHALYIISYPSLTATEA